MSKFGKYLPLIYLPLRIYLPLFYTNVKGFYGVMPCLAKNVSFTSKSILRAASQLFNAMSNDFCWTTSFAARSTSPSCVEIFGLFFKTISTYIYSLCKTYKWGVIEACICINLAFILASSADNATSSL